MLEVERKLNKKKVFICILILLILVTVPIVAIISKNNNTTIETNGIVQASQDNLIINDPIVEENLDGIVEQESLKEDIETITNIKQPRDLEQFKDRKLIAFTFDDGPSYYSTNKLLDNLDKYNARVTFFVLGSRVNQYKNTLKKAYQQGNQIGSHTYNHLDLLNLSEEDVLKEIKATNEEIEKIISVQPQLLRPPYGNTSLEIKQITNMYTILWDIDTEDWKYKDKEKIADIIVENAHDGGIVLLHDIYDTSVDGALLAMERLEKEGYAFVTIEEMCRIKGIEMEIFKSYRNF